MEKEEFFKNKTIIEKCHNKFPSLSWQEIWFILYDDNWNTSINWQEIKVEKLEDRLSIINRYREISKNMTVKQCIIFFKLRWFPIIPEDEFELDKYKKESVESINELSNVFKEYYNKKEKI